MYKSETKKEIIKLKRNFTKFENQNTITNIVVG